MRARNCGETWPYQLYFTGPKGVPEKDLADVEAKVIIVTDTSDSQRPISYTSTRSLICRTPIDPPPVNKPTKIVTVDSFGRKMAKKPSNALATHLS